MKLGLPSLDPFSKLDPREMEVPDELVVPTSPSSTEWNYNDENLCDVFE